MTWTNYHTHCRFCDGAGEPRDYARAALERRMPGLGFSSHAPVPFTTEWAMKHKDLEPYRDAVRDLAREFAGRIEIYLGLEIDFIPGVTGPANPLFESCGLDYAIGSVHFVDRFENGDRWGIDSTVELFERGLREIFGGRVRPFAERYFALVRQLLREQPPDILAHLDVLRKYNKNHQYIDETEPWYRRAVVETLEAVAESGVLLEVNTGPIARKRLDTTFPDRWALERAREMEIPVVLNSDVHNPELVDGEFENTARMLLDIGFGELMVFDGENWTPRPFTPKGLEPA